MIQCSEAVQAWAAVVSHLMQLLTRPNTTPASGTWCLSSAPASRVHLQLHRLQLMLVPAEFVRATSSMAASCQLPPAPSHKQQTIQMSMCCCCWLGSGIPSVLWRICARGVTSLVSS
mmetsp:Transcript_27494/g.60155  ORF Transcript_27494/g.60155 Transcript_27494/m.60155 type:complete len:117 (+) Transcript_27494:268-618(+)